MSDSLTARQTQILKALIDEYIETAEPVGSLALEKKYTLGVSPATVRNEMSALTKMGYLRQPHTSAGRVPSPVALKFYINQLMEEDQMSLADEVKAKESVWDSRHNIDTLMKEATKALSVKTDSLAVAALSDGVTWTCGHANIFGNPDLFTHQVYQSLFSAIDEPKHMKELFFERLTGVSPIEVLFGEELGWDFFDPIGIVGTRFQLGNKEGAIGVIGHFGLDYAAVIPVVRYFGNLIQELNEKAQA